MQSDGSIDGQPLLSPHNHVTGGANNTWLANVELVYDRRIRLIQYDVLMMVANVSLIDTNLERFIPHHLPPPKKHNERPGLIGIRFLFCYTPTLPCYPYVLLPFCPVIPPSGHVIWYSFWSWRQSCIVAPLPRYPYVLLPFCPVTPPSGHVICYFYWPWRQSCIVTPLNNTTSSVHSLGR